MKLIYGLVCSIAAFYYAREGVNFLAEAYEEHERDRMRLADVEAELAAMRLNKHREEIAEKESVSA